MSATTVNIVINHRSDFQLDFLLRTSPTSNTALNLTGYAVFAKMKPAFDSPDSQAESFNAFVSNTVEGRLTLALTDLQTAQLKHQKYVYDVVIENPNGFRTRVLEGRVTVRPGVT